MDSPCRHEHFPARGAGLYRAARSHCLEEDEGHAWKTSIKGGGGEVGHR